MTSCTCFIRSFWEGLCEWCTANPELQPPLDYQQVARACCIEAQSALDELVTKCAIELGWRAGLTVSGFDPDWYFEEGAGI